MKKLVLFIFIYSFFSFSVFSQSQYKLSCDSAQGQEFKKADTYVRASVDESGRLRIFTSDAREIVFQKDSEQVGFDKVVISKDGHSVGWLALYPNSSTSYPIPLKLMIYSSGGLSTLTGIGEPVWRWHFTARGKQVAFEQETTHGSQGIHYELREVATGRLIAEYEPEYGPDNLPLDIQNVPKWVEELNAD